MSSLMRLDARQRGVITQKNVRGVGRPLNLQSSDSLVALTPAMSPMQISPVTVKNVPLKHKEYLCLTR